MEIRRICGLDRRAFLRGMVASAGSGLLGFMPEHVSAEGALETTTIRIIADPKVPVLCYAPQYVAEHFLRMEGFSEVKFVPFYGSEYSESQTLIANEADITAELCPDWVVAVDRDDPVVIIAGLHAGCTEVFAAKNVRTIRDLKGKRIAISGGTEQLFVSSIASLIGLDPERDLEWVVANPNDWVGMLAAGEVDAMVTFPPMSYAVHDSKIGHVILNTTTDEPWKFYSCCLLGARQQFVNDNPIATKRALRAILKASLLCSQEPENTAQWLVDNGYSTNYQHTLATLQDIPYQSWREYDPEDAMRFYSLSLRKSGLIKKSPQEIISQGTNWVFLNELKQELKG